MLLEQLMAELQPLIITACVTIVTTVATWLGTQIKAVIAEKINTEVKKDVVETTCKYINQVYKDLDGATKLQKAKEESLILLNEKGIKITELELTVLIEAAVNGLKTGYGSSILTDTIAKSKAIETTTTDSE